MIWAGNRLFQSTGPPRKFFVQCTGVPTQLQLPRLIPDYIGSPGPWTRPYIRLLTCYSIQMVGKAQRVEVLSADEDTKEKWCGCHLPVIT